MVFLKTDKISKNFKTFESRVQVLAEENRKDWPENSNM